ncbi:hypothetical protein CDAR_385321 [Caerostris darwini]|uniref:Uncharacterized protein n=1 Tax=Caerostris darwini TaxID=1538125 RepID=A0AAV4NUM4_9ARAC|nr:hypothetical protein CDAR_385321 [Caerostris darwini]
MSLSTESVTNANNSTEARSLQRSDRPLYKRSVGKTCPGVLTPGPLFAAAQLHHLEYVNRYFVINLARSSNTVILEGFPIQLSCVLLTDLL